jgi:LysM domain
MVTMAGKGPAVVLGRRIAVAEPGPLRTRRARPPARLTRRGRVAVAGVAVLAAGALSVGLATAAQAGRGAAGASRGTAQASPGRYVAKVTVQPGQSLWSLAQAYDPDADPRDIVLQIQQLNSLPGAQLRAGQALWVPRG